MTGIKLIQERTGLEQTLVSIVMAVHNGEKYIANAIASILQQDYAPLEIIVVDSSTDLTAQVVTSIPMPPDVELHYFYQENQGIAATRNKGISLSRGRFITFLDHDDIWMPNKLSVQVSLMIQQPELAYTVTQMRIFLDTISDADKYWSTAENGRIIDGYTPSTLMARPALFEKIGGFDSNYTIGCDSDWFIRARDADISTTIIQEVLLAKRRHQYNLSLDTTLNRQEMFQMIAQHRARMKKNKLLKNT